MEERGRGGGGEGRGKGKERGREGKREPSTFCSSVRRLYTITRQTVLRGVWIAVSPLLMIKDLYKLVLLFPLNSL